MTAADCAKGAKSYKQQEYWESLLRKQEERNDHLSSRRCEIKHMMAVLEPPPADQCSPARSQPKYDCQLVPQKLDRQIVDLENTSVFSMHSTDLEYMQKIKSLADKQSCLQQELSTLQKRESAYRDTLKHAEQICGEKEMEYKKCICENGKSVQELEALKQANAKLMEDNRQLSDDVEDLQLEYAQYKENISGPITRQLEREKSRGKKLEQQMQEAAMAACGKDSKYLDQIYALQNKLTSLNNSLEEANNLHVKLQEERNCLTQQYENMQDELVNLKLKEAETIQQLSIALKGIKEEKEGCNCEVKVEKDLSCKCQSMANVNKPKSCDDDSRPKTAPPDMPDNKSRSDKDLEGQVTFGDDQATGEEQDVATSPASPEEEQDEDDVFEEKVLTPTPHTEIVYEPDGEVPE